MLPNVAFRYALDWARSYVYAGLRLQLPHTLACMCRFMRYKPHKMQMMKEVFLTYIAPVHYNAIRRRRPQQVYTCRVALSALSYGAAAHAWCDNAPAEHKSSPHVSF